MPTRLARVMLRRRTVLLVFLAAALAGCSGNPGRPTPTPSPDAPTPPPEPWLHFVQDAAVQAQTNPTPIYIGAVTGGNCLFIHFDSPWSMQNGTAEASWSPQSPAANRLQMVVVHLGGQLERNDVNGTSTLSATLPDVAGASDDERMLVSTEVPTVGLAIKQPVMVRLEFDYQSQTPPTLNLGGCGLAKPLS